MMKVETPWTVDQMLSLAPDALSARAAERLAAAQEWSALGRSASAVWGEFANHKGRSYRVAATVPDLALYCDCTARKRPCRHATSLALLLAREPALFNACPQPSWLDGALRKQVGAAPCEALSGDEYARRVRTLRQGMGRFEKWLRDLLHGGLSDLPERPVGEWNEMAGLLSDAQAPLPADELRGLRRAAGSGRHWPEQLLRRLGRLYLLAQAFAHYDRLPVENQADLRGAAGWFMDPDRCGDELLDGQWLVLGAGHELQGRQNVRRTWLFSLDYQRHAFYEHPVVGDWTAPVLPTGATIHAALRFTPSAWPQRAVVETMFDLENGRSSPAGYRSLRAAREAYGKVLSMNPWLRHMPFVLRGMSAVLDGEQWVLRDGEGYVLPLPQPFLYGWHLQILNELEGAALFGEWNGRWFEPLSILYGQQWLAIRVLRGQK